MIWRAAVFILLSALLSPSLHASQAPIDYDIIVREEVGATRYWYGCDIKSEQHNYTSSNHSSYVNALCEAGEGEPESDVFDTPYTLPTFLLAIKQGSNIIVYYNCREVRREVRAYDPYDISNPEERKIGKLYIDCAPLEIYADGLEKL